MQQIRQSLRDIKNNLVEKYYTVRINSSEDPYEILFKKEPYKILFILSHMRSGSSLLTHILNSNSAIIGYGETHIQYGTEPDFKPLIFKVYSKLKELQMHHEYVLDKVLHDHKFADPTFLKSPQLYHIFLLREPSRTLPSILGIKPHWSEEKAFNYYIQRLATLEEYAKIINNQEQSLFIDYEQLLKQTNAVFTALQSLLKTKDGFSEQYEILKMTGMKGVGDSSEQIKSGHIIRKPRPLEIEFSSELIEKAKESYHQCSETLSQYCRIIEP